MTDTNFIRVLDYAQNRADKAFKYTFLQSDRLLVGINCLLPGQGQHLHDHATQDKFYFVLEGTGEFTVGETAQHCSSGELILAPAGVPHGVENHGPERLSFLTVIAPFPSS